MNIEAKNILNAFDKNSSTIEKSQIFEWMNIENLEAKGVIYSKITDQSVMRKIQPPLTFEDYFNFVVPYLEQCIKENPDGDWSDSRYIAAHQLVAWFVDWWKDKNIPRKKIAELKGRLEILYKNGDEGTRSGLVNGVLEHLFAHKDIASYFKDWQSNKELRKAYEDALLWKKK